MCPPIVVLPSYTEDTRPKFVVSHRGGKRRLFVGFLARPPMTTSLKSQLNACDQGRQTGKRAREQ